MHAHVHVTVGFELAVGFCLGRLVWFVDDEYYCSETTTTQACLGYVYKSRSSQSSQAYTVLIRAKQPETAGLPGVLCANLFLDCL